MLAIFFLPLGAPGKDKSHVAPVHDITIVQRADECTTERLGDGVTPADCRSLITNAKGLVLRFRYDPRPCGGDRCTTATDVRVAIGGAPKQLLWTPSRGSALGTHSFAVDLTDRKDVCTTIEAVRLPENAISQTATTCVHVTSGPRPVATP